MTQTEKYICIRYPDNKCDRIPRSEAEKLVNQGKAVFTSKSRYKFYLKEEDKRIEAERQKALKEKAKVIRTKKTIKPK